jgi:hypothetical protein
MLARTFVLLCAAAVVAALLTTAQAAPTDTFATLAGAINSRDLALANSLFTQCDSFMDTWGSNCRVATSHNWNWYWANTYGVHMGVKVALNGERHFLVLQRSRGLWTKTPEIYRHDADPAYSFLEVIFGTTTTAASGTSGFKLYWAFRDASAGLPPRAVPKNVSVVSAFVREVSRNCSNAAGVATIGGLFAAPNDNSSVVVHHSRGRTTSSFSVSQFIAYRQAQTAQHAATSFAVEHSLESCGYATVTGSYTTLTAQTAGQPPVASFTDAAFFFKFAPASLAIAQLHIFYTN